MQAWWRTPWCMRKQGPSRSARRSPATPRARRKRRSAQIERLREEAQAHTNRAVADLKGSFEQIITQIGRQLEQMRGQFDTTSRGMHEAAQKTATDLDGLAPGDAEAHGDAARADRSDDGCHPQGPVRAGEGDRGDHAAAGAGGDASRQAASIQAVPPKSMQAAPMPTQGCAIPPYQQSPLPRPGQLPIPPAGYGGFAPQRGAETVIRLRPVAATAIRCAGPPGSRPGRRRHGSSGRQPCAAADGGRASLSAARRRPRRQFRSERILARAQSYAGGQSFGTRDVQPPRRPRSAAAISSGSTSSHGPSTSAPLPTSGIASEPGDRGALGRHIYSLDGQATFDEIVRRYDRDADFRVTVDRYIGDFERLLGEAEAERSGRPHAAELSRLGDGPRLSPARACERTAPLS